MIGNLSELAALPGMPSEPTIKKLIDENSDFPILKRGDRGVAWELDLGEAAEFIRDVQRREEAEARSRAEDVRQFGLSLLGDDAAALSPERGAVSAAERKALIEEELLAIKLGQARGEFMRRSEVETALGQLAVTMQQRFLTLTDRVAKRVTLPREAQAVMKRIVEADLGWVADQLEKLGNAASTDQSDTAVRDGGDVARADREADPAEGAVDGQPMGDRTSLL